MTDDELDRWLASARSPEPTRAFVAHVRERIARAPVPTSRHLWMWPAAAGAVGATAVAVVIFQAGASWHQATPALTDASITEDVRREPAALADVSPRSDAPSPQPPVRQRRPPVRMHAQMTETGGLRPRVAPDDRAAFALFLRSVQEGTLPPLPTHDGEPRIEAASIIPIDIAPLEVAPLEVTPLVTPDPVQGESP